MKLALLLTFALPLAFGDQCPFSDTNECQCTFQGPPSNNRFSLVDCISSGLPSFTGEQLYDVSGRLSIRGDVSTIPANHFQAFIGITDLYLEQIIGTEPVYHNWNAQSFEGPLAIWNMTVIGLAGLFPLKPSNWFGSRLQIALSRLSISKSPSLSFVDDDGFSSMMLQTLEVTDSQIQSLSPNAFNDLPILDRLTLENAGLTSFVLGDWSVIKNVTLDQNGKLSRVSLDKLMLAETISLNGNDLAQAAMEESFSIPSSYLVDIFMENCALASLSPRLFGPYSHPTGTFSLARNDIQTLTSSDFQQCDNLSVLILRDNLISKIDAGVFDPLTKLSKLDLADALRMPTVDLSEFYKVGSGLQSPTKVSILLDNNNFIKTIVSGSTRFFSTPTIISLTHTSMETLDPSIWYLAIYNPYLTFDISKNAHLHCDQLDWLAWFVTCSKQVNIDSTTCVDKNNQLLADYLKQVAPNPDCSSTPGGPSTTPVSSTAWTTTQSSTTPSGQCQEAITVTCNCNCK